MQGKEKLAAGRWVVIFPEGTRVNPGEVGRYSRSGAQLALEAGYPVVPIAHNAGKYWPKSGFIKHPGTIKVVIGKPIGVEGKTAETLTSSAKEWIEGQQSVID